MNLWIYYIGGYVIAYTARFFAERARGEPFEDPELMMRPAVLSTALFWMILGLIITLFTPSSTGTQLIVGEIVLIIGMIIVLFAFHSFAKNAGLNVSRLHGVSRNPNYIGWDIFMGGLAIIGWSKNIWGYLCVFYFLYTIIYLHFTILTEEKFLAEKYGSQYTEYFKNIPRYFWKF